MSDNPYGTRAEHLAWCKERAFEYLDTGDLVNAWSSFTSDLQKHEETAVAPEILGLVMMADIIPAMEMKDTQRVRRAIEGFN